MSIIARAVAPAPSGSNFEALTNRLLALRAEIDAILAELASQAMETQRAEESLPVLSDPLTDGELAHESPDVVEDAQAAPAPSADEHATGEPLEPLQIVAIAAPEQPLVDAATLDPAELEQKTRDSTDPASDDPTCIVSVDTEHADATGQSPETEVSAAVEVSPEPAAKSAEQFDDAVVLDASKHFSAEPTQSEEVPHEPAALENTGLSAADGAQTSDGPIVPIAPVVELPADATVVSLHTRHRKQKGELAVTATRPVRYSRHLAAKIAACILVLLTAATILVMADRTAMGSVPSFPWTSPMPSGPVATDPALQHDRRDAAAGSDNAAAAVDFPPLADGLFLLLRYRETSPSGF